MGKKKEVQTVAIVGTGVIGASWAALYLARGLKVVATDPAPNAEANLRTYIDAAWIGTFTEFSPQVKQTIIDGVLKEAGNRSISELAHERDSMLLELLATRARGEKEAQAAIAKAGQGKA